LRTTAFAAARYHVFDPRQVFYGLDAVHAQVVVRHVEHDADVAAVERQAPLEDAAARRFQHREIDVRRAQHIAGRPVAGAVAAHHFHAVEVDALGRGHAGRAPGQARAVGQHQGGGGLAVGAGDRHHGDAPVAGAEHGLDDGGACVARLAAARVVVHADARRRVDFDDGAALLLERLRDVAADDVDAGDVEADFLRGPHAQHARALG
jgi:hypothetical protein